MPEICEANDSQTVISGHRLTRKLMAAGSDRKNLSDGNSAVVNATDLDETNTEEEIEDLNNLLSHLEQCVENLDQQATSLTDKIKQFLEESRNDSSSETPSEAPQGTI